MERLDAYSVVSASLDSCGLIDGSGLQKMTERHFFDMPVVQFKPVGEFKSAFTATLGVVFLMDRGIPTRAQLAAMGAALKLGKRVFAYWPAERAIEVVDRERLGSLWRHRIASALAVRFKAWRDRRRAKAAAASSISAAVNHSPQVQATIAHIGLEAEGLEGHLKGAVAELRVTSSRISGEMTAHSEAAAGQLDAALTAQTSASAMASVRHALAALEGVRQAIPAVGALGRGMADHIEGGLPVLDRIRQQAKAAASQMPGSAASAAAAPQVPSAAPAASALPSVAAFLRSIAESPSPVPLRPDMIPTSKRPLPGTGLYLRLDFWAPLTSGGSYGHTCYQAKALAEVSEDFVSVTSNRFELLDKLGVRQVIVPSPDASQTEANLLLMNSFYRDKLEIMFETLRPAYIFERAVLGSAVGAWASRRFKIPYIVEYNGSEISMKRSFANGGFDHEDLLLLAEDAAFRQATAISVVSERVAEMVTARGVPSEKILVNPNAVDLGSYGPAAPADRTKLRTSLGFKDADCVVGFIGTFGGWHGIDVLAPALPLIAKGNPEIRFLMIGDGNLKHQVTNAVRDNRLEDVVVDVGRVPQERGAELLKACDILVSPHSSNMVDNRFFGSPTKVFEYMAMGVGIVASDLEQIGSVLSPALRPSDFSAMAPAVQDQRSVLCKPGSVEDFANGVLHLSRNPAVAAALGKNARSAAEKHHTWQQHVENLWTFLNARNSETRIDYRPSEMRN